jgi:adenylate kinase family enzyme
VAERGWLLDGYPRSASQAEAIEKEGIRPDVFLLIEVGRKRGKGGDGSGAGAYSGRAQGTRLAGGRPAGPSPPAPPPPQVPSELLVERVVGRRLDPDTGAIYHLKYNPPPPAAVPRLVQRSDDTEEKVGGGGGGGGGAGGGQLGRSGGRCRWNAAAGQRAGRGGASSGTPPAPRPFHPPASSCTLDPQPPPPPAQCKTRLETHFKNVEAVMGYYNVCCVEVDGNRSMDAVFSSVCAAIDEAQ